MGVAEIDIGTAERAQRLADGRSAPPAPGCSAAVSIVNPRLRWRSEGPPGPRNDISGSMRDPGPAGGRPKADCRAAVLGQLSPRRNEQSGASVAL